MLTFVSFFFFIVLTIGQWVNAQSLQCECRDFEPQHDRRIVGGSVPDQHAFPFLVGLYAGRGSREPFCGGVIISDSHILTAAHCVQGPYRVYAVSVCDHRLHDVRDGGFMALVSGYDRDAVVHPLYRKGERLLDFDVAVLTLRRPLRASQRSNCPSPICLSEVDSSVRRAMVAGWGVTESGGGHSRSLLHATLPIVSNEQCERIYGKDIDTQHICAGGQGEDTCQGDSGGPLFIRKTRDKFQLVGVTSFGLGCGIQGVPGGYVRVAHPLIIDFIHTRLGVKSPCGHY